MKDIKRTPRLYLTGYKINQIIHFIYEGKNLTGKVVRIGSIGVDVDVNGTYYYVVQKNQFSKDNYISYNRINKSDLKTNKIK